MKLIFFISLYLIVSFVFSQNKQALGQNNLEKEYTGLSLNDSILANNKIDENSFQLQSLSIDSLGINNNFLNDRSHFNKLNSSVTNFSNGSIFNGINDLDVVEVKSYRRINAVSLGILQKEIKPLTQYERRLYTAGDFKWYHLFNLLGGNLEVDPIINAITGRTKRIKGYIEIERKISSIDYIEETQTEYITENLDIPKDLQGRFITYLVEDENFKVNFKNLNDSKLRFYMAELSVKFKELQEDSTMPIDFLKNEKKVGH